MECKRFFWTGAVVFLAACAGGPGAGGVRPMFDTSRGVAGTNEFSPRGVDTADDSAAPAPAAPAPVAVVRAPAPAAVAAPAPAPAPAPVAAAAPVTETRISIDANAYAAVFGAAAAPVRPTAAQLMQLDSVAFLAAEAPRMELQRNILACRRAGDACRLAPQ